MPSYKPNPIRVLVVDDSFFMRKMIQDMLEASDGVATVLDTAQNGLEAVEKTIKLKPDVITLDVEMPQMDGLQALERIMAERPTPVVMLSSHTGEGTVTTIRALELGAVDCLGKPAGRVMENMKEIQAELIEKIKLASTIRPRQRTGTALGPKASASTVEITEPSKHIPQVERPATFIVAIASSTGGPRALNELFSNLQRTPHAAYVIVQHISVGLHQGPGPAIGGCQLCVRCGSTGPGNSPRGARLCGSRWQPSGFGKGCRALPGRFSRFAPPLGGQALGGYYDGLGGQGCGQGMHGSGANRHGAGWDRGFERNPGRRRQNLRPGR